ncbi:MAG: DUF2752 domain-containing protein, partial [Bacteroidia bacterium]
ISGDKGILSWLKTHLLTCPIKSYTGIDCPGCGFQRSIVALLEGDVVSSFKLFPATIPFIFLLVFTLVHLKFELRYGAFFIKILYIGISLIIVINYIYKIFNHQLV